MPKVRAAFDDAAIGMALVGLDGSWIEVNPAVCDLVGYSRDDLLKMDFQTITHPDDLDADLQQLGALVGGRIPSYEMEKRYFHSDGRTIWVLLTVTLVRHDDGAPAHFISQIQDITQRKVVEEALRESEGRFRQLFEASPDGIFMADSSGCVVDCNRSLSRITSYTPSELKGHDRFEFLTDSCVLADLRKLFHGGPEIRERIVNVRRADASRSRGLMTVVRHTSASGGTSGFHGQIHDLTAKEESELLRNRYRALIESSADAIISSDMDGNILTWNRGAEKMFGYSSDVAVRSRVGLIAPNDRPNEGAEMLRRIRAGEDIVDFETVRQHKDGHPVDVSLTVSRMMDARGVVTGFSVIGRDISERKAAERDTVKRREALSAIVSVQQDLSTEGITREDVASLIARQALDLAGADGAAVLTREGDELVYFSTVGSLLPHRGYRYPMEGSLSGMAISEGKTLFCGDCQNDSRTARDVVRDLNIVSLVVVPLDPSHSGGEMIQVVSHSRDAFGPEAIQMLELVGGVMAAALRAATDFDRQKVLLAEREAYASELERSNIALQDFASIASHDLQEPLRKVQAFGDRLGSRYGDVLDEKGLDYLNRMRDAAGRMRKLIEDLLTFSRVTSHAMPMEPVNLNDVLEEVVDDLSVRIENSGGEVRNGPMPTLDADRLQMKQLFQNLIANALKFKKEDVAPVVLVSAESAGDGMIRIQVKDNGVGFDPSYAQQIFKPFERLHGRSEYEGTGIGLAICRKIVERHRGHIVADGEIDVGCTFTITIPQHSKN